MPRVGLEPAISVFGRIKTCLVLDTAASAMGQCSCKSGAGSHKIMK
jgi:hypothetical protein